MGYTTDFLGHLEISPRLNDAEVEYLTAFSESRRWDRPQGPYAVPDNPRAEDDETAPVERTNRPAPGQPGLWCQWLPCPTGCCLSDDGTEKFYAPVAWLTYLVEHFLRPGALAGRSGSPVFEQFTFDHVLDGTVVARRRDTRRMWVIELNQNVLTERVLVEGDDPSQVWGGYPFETARDQLRAARSARRPLVAGPVARPAP